jgi:hypothetical protein
MQKTKLIYGLMIFLAALAPGCEQDSSMDIPEPDDLIVVDGWIENGQFARVLLTRNAPYFSSIDSASIRSLVLTQAKVTLSDGENSETLILRKNTDYFPPYVFEGNEITGETGKRYTLHATFGGKTATATTTIPEPVAIDTVFFELNAGSDSLGSIYLAFTDPADVKNYYRILTKRIGTDSRYYATMIMALDDIYFSGEQFNFSFSNGPDNFLTSFGNDYFKTGDTVSIKFCTIDEDHFLFWDSFQEEVFNAVNPFATSMLDVQSNIEGDGLGIWGGYGAVYHTLIIPQEQ